MKIENNCLVTEYCTYPFDVINVLGNVDTDYAICVLRNLDGQPETAGMRNRNIERLNKWTFELYITDEKFLTENNISNANGWVILVPLSDEAQVRECWNAINEYKQLPKPKTVKKPKVTEQENE